MAKKQVLNEDIIALILGLLDMSLYLPIPKRSKKLYKAAAKDYKSLHANFRSIFPDLKTNQQRQLHKKVMKDLDALGVEFKNLLKQVNKDYDTDKEDHKKYLEKEKKNKWNFFGFGKYNKKNIVESIKVIDYLKEQAWASTDGKPLDFKYDPGKGKLTEISAKAGLEDVIKGRTSSIEGIKMSKDLAEAIMDWIKSSSYGRKYGKQILKGRIHALIKPADAWGIERFFKGRRVSSSKLNQEWKNIVSKIKEGAINEQVKLSSQGIWKNTKKYKIQRPPRNFAKKAKMGAMIHFTGHKSGAKGETWSKVFRDEWMAIYGEGVKGDTLSSKDLDKKLEKHARVQIKEGALKELFKEQDEYVSSYMKLLPIQRDALHSWYADKTGGDFTTLLPIQRNMYSDKLMDMSSGDKVTTDFQKEVESYFPKDDVGLNPGALKEGVPFPQTEPNEFAFFDFKKWAYKNRGKLKKELLKHKDNPGKLWNKLCDIWVEWAKKTNNKDFSRITDKQKFGRALAIMLKKQNVLFDKNPRPSHKIAVKEQSQFFGPGKTAPPERKIKRKILNVPIYDETPEEVDARRARIKQRGIEQDRITNLKDELGGSWGPFVKKGSWAHKINQAIKVGELDPSRDDWDDHAAEWKSHVGDMESGIDPTTYTLGTDKLGDVIDEMIKRELKEQDYKIDKDQLNMYVKQNPNVSKKTFKNVFKDMQITPSDTLMVNTSMDSGHARNMGNFDVTTMIANNKGATNNPDGVSVNYSDRESYSPDGSGNFPQATYQNQKSGDYTHFIKSLKNPNVSERLNKMVREEYDKILKEQMAPSQVKFLSGQLKLKKGDKITYDQHFQFGKVSKNVTAKVIAVKGHTVFLDKGPELDLRQDPIKKINNKSIK